MTSTIFKYEIEATETALRMPMGAEILTVGNQHEKICLWVKVRPDSETEARTILLYGTGQIIPDRPMQYIGTVLLDGGDSVLHVFEAVNLRGVNNGH